VTNLFVGITHGFPLLSEQLGDFSDGQLRVLLAHLWATLLREKEEGGHSFLWSVGILLLLFLIGLLGYIFLVNRFLDGLSLYNNGGLLLRIALDDFLDLLRFCWSSGCVLQDKLQMRIQF
jgi:hypothetical protein